VELWVPAQKTGIRKGTPAQMGFYSYGQLGHLAKDCNISGNGGKEVNSSTSLKGKNLEKRRRKRSLDVGILQGSVPVGPSSVEQGSLVIIAVGDLW